MQTHRNEVKTVLPAPTADVPVRVSLDDTPAWLAFHGLEIVGWDEKRGGALVRKKTIEPDVDDDGRDVWN